MKFAGAVVSLAIAVAAGASAPAFAADLYGGDGGSIKDEPYVYQTPGPSGWYLRADGAWAAYDIDDLAVEDMGLINPPSAIASASSDIDSGWSFGGGVGRYFGLGFRGDLTLEYRTSVDVSGTADASCCTIGTKTDVDGIVGLANLYYDFNRGGRFVPYLGAGIGFAHLKSGGGTLGCVVGCGASFGDAVYSSESTTNFAVAAMAGLSFKIFSSGPSYGGGMKGSIKDAPVMVSSGRDLYLDVGYRFLYLGDLETASAVQTNGNVLEVGADNLMAHEVRVGLRYDLN